MNQPNRLFAVVPAAGRSRRMGRPKLLLPLGQKTVIARLLGVLDHPGITETVVVVHPDDDALCEEVGSTKAIVIQPREAPAEMRHSVELALTELENRHHPTRHDGWLLLPADHPMFDADLLDQLIQLWNQAAPAILVPRHGEKRGHPTFFRWTFAHRVPAIPSGCGLNWLLDQHAHEIMELAIDSPAVVTDLDTPEDYREVLDHWTGRQRETRGEGEL